MSWMDSWSRPKKSAVTPPPLYLTNPDTPYCHTCGRVISSRKAATTKSTTTPTKYCSDRCRNNKPSKQDRRIEDAFVGLLNGADPASLAIDPHNPPNPAPPTLKSDFVQKKKPAKGDPRITISCLEVEELIFGSRHDPEKTHGRKRNKAKRTLGSDTDEDDEYDEYHSGGFIASPRNRGTSTLPDDNNNVSDNDTASINSISTSGGGVPLPISDAAASRVFVDHANFGAGKQRPAQMESEVNFSVGGERGWAEKLEETPEMLEKRREGQRRAEEREMVRCAARRLCAFGCVVVGEVEEVYEERKPKKKGKGRKGVKEEEEHDESGGVSKERRKMCEALMKGVVVEGSYAKGEWGIRWREEV